MWTVDNTEIMIEADMFTKKREGQDLHRKQDTAKGKQEGSLAAYLLGEHIMRKYARHLSKSTNVGSVKQNWGKTHNTLVQSKKKPVFESCQPLFMPLLDER